MVPAWAVPVKRSKMEKRCKRQYARMARFSLERRFCGMNNIDLTVNLAGIILENPITTASGTFSPADSGKFYDINQLGAVITKGIAIQAWEATQRQELEKPTEEC